MRKIRSFTRNKRDVKQLILEVCFLAKLERIYRSGLPPRDIFDRSFFYKPDDEVIRDLELLCNMFSERFIPLVNSASKVAYNPHFGAASAFVGGADADIIIDGTLYDFKTSKAIGYKWQEIAQIIGYYLLNDISTDIDKRNSPILERDFYEYLHIKRIAFYRARYGEVEYINILTINQENIQSAKKKLCAYFLKYSSLNKYMIENHHLLEEIANN